VAEESPRRLGALVAGLPSDAAVWREDVPAWTQEHELQANVVEAVDHWSRLIFSVLAVLGGNEWPGEDVLGPPIRIEHPDRVERPEDDESESSDLDGEEAPPPPKRRPRTKQKSKEADQGTDPGEIAAFFGVNKK
jgi:hypothetical protein